MTVSAAQSSNQQLLTQPQQLNQHLSPVLDFAFPGDTSLPDFNRDLDELLAVMSQRANGEARTPGGRYRRSDRLSARANSVAADSVVTNATATAAAKRTTATLTKVSSRRSNAYGASGRTGAPDKLPAAPATGFTQAMENQLEKYANDEEEEEEEDHQSQRDDNKGDVVDELGSEPQSLFIRQIRNSGKLSPDNLPNPASKSKVTPAYSFIDSDDFSHSDDDLAASVGNTTKSFGLAHEAGMLVSQDPFARAPARDEPRSSPFVKPAGPNRKPDLAASAGNTKSNGLVHEAATSGAQDPFARPAVPNRRPASRTVNGARTQGPTPVLSQGSVRNRAPVQAKTPTQAENHIKAPIRTNLDQPTARATSVEIDGSLGDLIAEEQTRLQQGPPPQPERRRPHQKDRVELNAWLGDVEPAEIDEPVWAWKKYLIWAFGALAGLVLLSYLISSAMVATPFPESAARKPGLVKAVEARVNYMYEGLADFILPPTEYKPSEAELAQAYKNNGDDNLLWGRMSNIEKRNNKHLEDVRADMRTAIEELKQELPEIMIVRRNEDGSSEITDEFWMALTGKTRSSMGDNEWARYIEQTKTKLGELFDTTTHQERSHTDSWPQAVSRDEFVTFMERRYENLTAQVDKKIDEAIRSQSAQFKTMVQAEARKTMMDQIRLNSLAQANLVANYELHLTKPNYFSPGLGAVVEPDLSSVTLSNRPGGVYSLMRRWALVPNRNPPMAALTKWEEPGDCWCSAGQAPVSSGQAQLTVRLARPVIPKQVTIEHVPMSMMPARDISNAPRDIELWVQTDAPINPYYSHRQVTCRDPAPPSFDGPAWKCLGSFKYNIHASNHLQTFDLAGEPSQPVQKAMIRVTSNWGAGHTCLYQVRLHGTDAEKDFEYPVSLMD
jgi:SUN domain-containing protein 1/2